MGTKARPGTHDCYAKASPDEPLFTLLARDPAAADLVREWAERRAALAQTTNRLTEEGPKIAEALAVARAMDAWRARNIHAAPLPVRTTLPAHG